MAASIGIFEVFCYECGFLQEPNGTQVLIPIKWGLIELYTTKHVRFYPSSLVKSFYPRFGVHGVGETLC